MFENYRIVAVTPAGRKRYLEILLQYILRDFNTIDEWHLWLNTDNEKDLAYCKSIARKYSFIKLIHPSVPYNNSLSIYQFFIHCTDKQTIYIRFDDDIVWIEEGGLYRLLKFRVDNPDFFLVFPNIINNSLCSHLHQRLGQIPLDRLCNYSVLDRNGWGDPVVCEVIHNSFLRNLRTNRLDGYKFKQWILHAYERFSINSFVFFGRTFAEFEGKVHHDEENWLSVTKPREIGKYNCIFGECLVSHFAYYTQRQKLEETDVLEKYRNIKVDCSLFSDLFDNKIKKLKTSAIHRRKIK